MEPTIFFNRRKAEFSFLPICSVLSCCHVFKEYFDCYVREVLYFPSTFGPLCTSLCVCVLPHRQHFLPPSSFFCPSGYFSILSVQAVILAPVSHRQLQPLRDYLCWAPVAAGRSQQRKVTHCRGRSVSTAFALWGLFPLLEKER